MSEKSNLITLQCPDCGSEDFELMQENEMLQCVDCGGKLTKDELIEQNAELIAKHKAEFAE